MKVFCESFGGDRRQSQTRLEFPSPLLLPGYYPQVVRLDTGLFCLRERTAALLSRRDNRE